MARADATPQDARKRTLSVEGQDEDAAIEEIQRLITDKFGEEE